ncbi:MAG: winged helix-turn-helix domain-containing protein [Anaerolineae bacterium]
MVSTPPCSILVASTDPATQAQLQALFVGEGCRVWAANSISQCVRHLQSGQVDLALLDAAHADPSWDPWKACRQVQAAVVPCIIIASTGQDVQRALEVGAEDAMLFPPHPGELTARVRAVLRRRPGPVLERKAHLYLDRDLLIDFRTHEVWVRGQRVHLTPQEYALLAALARHTDQVLSPAQLVWMAWGEPAASARRSVLKQYIWRLRQKVERTPNRPEILVTHRGEGYEFRRIWQEGK